MTFYIFRVISHRKLKKFHDRATNGETNIGSYIDDTSSIGTAAAHYINDTSSIGTQWVKAKIYESFCKKWWIIPQK